MAQQKYTAKDITVLEGLEPVRKRPGMYIGGVDATGLHHLVWELLDNSVDEAMNGHCDKIVVTLHKDGETITVSDNGRGIPVDVHPKHKRSALELILTTLHAGGKFENRNYYHCRRPARRRRLGGHRAVLLAGRHRQARRLPLGADASRAACRPASSRRSGRRAARGTTITFTARRADLSRRPSSSRR